MSKDRPSRRLSLTQPTIPAPVAESAPVPTPEAPSVAPTPAESTAAQKVMVYLDPDEAEALDALWIRMRRHPRKPSKSDLLRAGLLALLEDPDQVDSALSRLRTSTQARQRASRQG